MSKDGGKSIRNEYGVPIWVRDGCKCATCRALRTLEKQRNKKKEK